MLDLIPSLIVYGIELLISYIFFSYIAERKRPAIVTGLIGLLIFESGAFVNYFFANTVWINTAYSAVINFAFAMICFDIPVRAAAIYSVLLDMLSIAFEFITIFSISAIIGTETTEYNSNFAILALETAVCKSLYYISCLGLLRIIRKNKAPAEKFPASFYIYPVCTLAALLAFWYICARENLSDSNQIIIACISVLLLLSAVMLFITYRRNIARESEYIRAISENRILQTEKTYYDILEHQNSQLMLYAHDARKHLFAIGNLSDDPQISDYIDRLLDRLGSYTRNCHSGNKILDVLINKYVTECELYGIDFRYDVKPCNLSGVDDIDIVSILGNLMDNALSAAASSEEKSISLETTWRNAYNVVVITNSCDKRPVAVGKKLRSTKEEDGMHGHGLTSAALTLKKYGGDYSWEYDEEKHLFTTVVMLKPKGIE